MTDVPTVRATSSRHRYLSSGSVDRLLLDTPNCDGSLLCVCGHRQETTYGYGCLCLAKMLERLYVVHTAMHSDLVLRASPGNTS